MDFVVLEDHSERKQKQSRNKYLDLAIKLKKLWNMKVILILIGALRTIHEDLVMGLEESEIGGRAETIQSTALLRLTRILRRVQGT